MRRLGLLGVVVVPLLAAVLSSVSPSAGASAGVTRPGPPTAARATYIAGVRGVSVSWRAPALDGGSPILYYVASNYSGKYRCVSLNPGPDGCHIDGLRIGNVVHHVRVRAINSRGIGQVVVILPVATSGSSGGASATPPSGVSPASMTQLPSTPTSAIDAATSDMLAASSATSGTQGTDVPAALPFTGANLEVLLMLGVSLVFGGLLILRRAGQRRRVLSQTSNWLLGL